MRDAPKEFSHANAPRTRLVPATWLVTVILASGLLYIIQDATGSQAVPVLLGAAAILVLMAAVSFLGGARPVVPRGVALAILFFVVSAVLATVVAAAGGATDDLAASFTFMYGIGILIGAALVAPISVRRSLVLTFFLAGAILFGLVQVMAGSLLVPQSYREEYGIVFETFVNGGLRVSSIFASPPRFAEVLVYAILHLVYFLLSWDRCRLFLMVGIVVSLFVLYHTYSRSGYVLLLGGLLLLLLLVRARGPRVVRDRQNWAVPTIAGAAASVVLAVGAASFDVDSSLADSTSMGARIGNWQSLLSFFRQLGTLQLLFGTGRSAHYSFLNQGYFVVDNLYLSIFLYGGLLGMTAFALMATALAREGLQRAYERPERWLPFLAMSGASLLEGFFVDNHNTVFLLGFVAVGLIGSESGASSRIVRPASSLRRLYST